MVDRPENPEIKPQDKLNEHEKKMEGQLDWSHLV